MTLDLIIVAIVLINFFLLYFKQLVSCIHFVAAQGVLVGILPFLFFAGQLNAKTVIVSCITIALKGLVFPIFYFYALRKGSIRAYVEPFVGYKFSIMTGLVALVISFWLSHQLHIPRAAVSSLVIPSSFFTIFIGLFLIITRIKAITQSLAYLVIEDGIYMFSFAFLIDQPLLVELGILLDVFAAVFVMGITIFHISRTFNHINTLKMTSLKD
jgi:hydrogenase-4 component E